MSRNPDIRFAIYAGQKRSLADRIVGWIWLGLLIFGALRFIALLLGAFS